MSVLYLSVLCESKFYSELIRVMSKNIDLIDLSVNFEIPDYWGIENSVSSGFWDDKES